MSTTGSSGEFSRLTRVCSARTICEAMTTGSFVFSGLALVAFVAAWKSGAFHELDSHASIPLLVEEEDYYTPDWAFDEEEWV